MEQASPSSHQIGLLLQDPLVVGLDCISLSDPVFLAPPLWAACRSPAASAAAIREIHCPCQQARPRRRRALRRRGGALVVAVREPPRSAADRARTPSIRRSSISDVTSIVLFFAIFGWKNVAAVDERRLVAAQGRPQERPTVRTGHQRRSIWSASTSSSSAEEGNRRFADRSRVVLAVLERELNVIELTRKIDRHLGGLQFRGCGAGQAFFESTNRPCSRTRLRLPAGSRNGPISWHATPRLDDLALDDVVEGRRFRR